MRYYTEFSHVENDCALMKNNRIGLLGGTFNPVHNGHIAMAKIALYEFLLGEVVFLPLGTPPHKRNEHIAPPDCRLDMIKLAIGDESRFSVSTIELYREGYTYTVDTLSLLLDKNRNCEYFYIIGADTLFEIVNWKDYEKVIRMASFICVPRPGLDESKVISLAERYNEKYGHKFYISEEKGPDISSTHIRDMALRGMLRGGLVPEKVAEYIICNGVYCKGD